MTEVLMNVLQIDFHVHAGSEMWSTPREAFFTALDALGIRMSGLLDHAEFYFESKPDWVANSIRTQKERGIDVGDRSEAGLRAFCQELRAVRATGAHDFFIGLEFADADRLPESFLAHPEYVSNCFGISTADGVARGRRAAEDIRRLGRKIRSSGKPGILNHAFRPLVLKAREAAMAGTPVAHELLICADDVHRVCDAVMEEGLFLEFNTGTIRLVEDCRGALDFFIYVLRLVEERGPNMSVGSDSHQPTPPLTDGIRYVVENAALGDARFVALTERMLG